MNDSSRCENALFWFRRDLRDYDNAGLHHALKSSQRVFCTFIFDREILDGLPNKADRRVEFIWQSVAELRASLQAQGGDLIVRHGFADDEVPRLAVELGADAVFTNRDYEPPAIARDKRVERSLTHLGIAFKPFKDTVIFEGDEVLTQAGGRFSIFTAYKNAWLKKLHANGSFYVRAYPVEKYASRFAKSPHKEDMPMLRTMGFGVTNLQPLGVMAGMRGGQSLLQGFRQRMPQYKQARDFPGVKGVSYLSVHNRFGTVSIRELAAMALAENNQGAETWLSELIWRDFYFQILYHHPHVVAFAFRPEYNAIAWHNDETLFDAWCEARTGYPIVDAAMRQINQTGYMHNRLRMIVASFLTKDLHIDWRWGEKYFADNLIDFDLAANNGGWQWAASTGCDAQPWFRIFNPVTQSQRFDPDGKFIRRYLPELRDVTDKFLHSPWSMPLAEQRAARCMVGTDYPAPIVDHAAARDITLAMFKAARQ